MCIAIVKTKTGKITEQQLRTCFQNNPHGAGIAYSKDNLLYMIKGIFNEDAFVETYNKIEPIAEGAMLIHCRIATSGKTDYDNCHPHIVNTHCVMIHNGVLSYPVPKDSPKSDTVLFVENVLKPLPEDFMSDPAIMYLISAAIGKSNKFCFLNNKGEYSIANEEQGEWKDGVWFSNDSYEDWGYAGWGWTGRDYDAYESYDWKDYYKNYKDYREESEELECAAALNEDQWNELQKVILNLTPDELIVLGEDPVFCYYDGTLLPTETALSEDDAQENYLSLVDDMLYQMYYELYETAWINQPDVAEDVEYEVVEEAPKEIDTKPLKLVK